MLHLTADVEQVNWDLETSRDDSRKKAGKTIANGNMKIKTSRSPSDTTIGLFKGPDNHVQANYVARSGYTRRCRVISTATIWIYSERTPR